MAARASVKEMAKASGTTILLQHNGLPRSPFYAKRQLKGQYENSGIPSIISGQLASLRYRYSKKIQAAMCRTGDYSALEESHRRFGVELSKKLNAVLPEFGPFNTRVSYLYDEPYISDELRQIIEDGTDRLIVMSLYPFRISHYLDPMKKATSHVLSKTLSEVYNFSSGKIMYAAKDQPVSFEMQRLDSIGSHPSFFQYWSERLLANIGEADAIIFAVPAPSILGLHKYFETVHNSADEIIHSIHTRFDRAVSYRVAFYAPWDHSVPFFPISKSVPAQIGMLARFRRHDPLIIPFWSLFKDFDTEYVLPANNPYVQILKPDEQDTNLVHSFVELLKTRILTDKYQSDKTPQDPLF